MNIFRPTKLGISLGRALSTSTPFIPPPSLRNIEQDFRRAKFESKPKPESPAFYTGRASYYDQLIQLETAIQYSRRALTTLQLLPLPAFARAKLPSLQPTWRSKDDMSSLLESILTTSRYRRVTNLLDQLSEYQRIATTSGCYDLGNNISSILELFQKDSVEDLMVRKKRRPVPIDEYGRSYTVGKRKTSAARVWIIRVQPKGREPTNVAQSDAEIADELLEINPPKRESPDSSPSEIPTTTVLINNIPLAEYFRVPADRERIIRPLKLAGVLGAYNVFTLVRGGGTTGQSGAIAHGIAKGLLAHEPQVEAILRRAKLVRRDPRMVERKKTGLAKARKRYTWVKR